MLPFNRLRLFKVLNWVTDGASGGWEPGMEPDPMANLEETTSLREADIVTSEPRPTEFDKAFELTPKHMVMFDCDVPVMVIPSSTPGHSHIYFPNNHVSKEDLFNLLDALANVGIVERGYAEASKARGFTALRLPWVSKDNRPIKAFGS